MDDIVDEMMSCKSGSVHKNLQAKERCWACSHPEKLELQEGDAEMVLALVRAGWRSVSNKYKTVKHVPTPSMEEAITFSPEAPGWLVKEVTRRWRGIVEGGWHAAEGETRELTPAQYAEFKRVVRTRELRQFAKITSFLPPGGAY